MSYSGVGILSLIVHFIVNFEAIIRTNNSATAPVRSRYRLFLISAMIYYAVDATWGIAYETRILPFVFAFTTLYFLAISLTVLFWMRFIIAYLNRVSVLKNRIYTRALQIYHPGNAYHTLFRDSPVYLCRSFQKGIIREG